MAAQSSSSYKDFDPFAKKRKLSSSRTGDETGAPPENMAMIVAPIPQAQVDEPQAMAELLFRERTRLALDFNPAYVSRLEKRRELGYYANPANRRLQFTTFDLNVAEFRRCITQVMTRVLHVRYYDRSNLRATEITAEIAVIVPLTVSACMCAVYAKLRQIHRQHGRLATRYPTPPHYNKDIELPLPLALAIQELGMFQTESLEQNLLLAPTYPEATLYEGRAVDAFNITDYQTYVPTFKDLGIPCKSVDPNLKKGSAWWTYRLTNSEGTTDLLCAMPPTCYSDLAAAIRMLFLATSDEPDDTTCSEIFNWPDNMNDFGTHLRESPPNSNTRAFLALCQGPKEEWSNGYA